MKILTQGDRHSERIIRRLTADILNIPETDDGDVQKSAMDDVECKCGKCGKCAKEASETAEAADEGVTASTCPQCDTPMQVIANIERCVCGYGQPAKKRAEETGVGEYYRKIFPDAYVSEMTGDPTPTSGEKEVSYEMKPNTEVKVSARDIIQKKHKRIKRKMHGANETSGECTVPDDHPESGVGAGSAGESSPEPKMQGDESANSVTGPEKAKSHGPGLQEPGSVSAPDLGLPKGAGKEWISREVMAVLCPPCAQEMAQRGITRVKASTIAGLLAKRADETGFASKKEGTGCAPGKKDPKGVRRAPKAP
jgi:hypothetical protein